MFQSAHPVKGAINEMLEAHNKGHVSIRAPREGCDDNMDTAISLIEVSIRAPREGCDGIL